MVFCSPPRKDENQKRLRVALVSGTESEAYQANHAMSLLKSYLEENYPIDCVLVTSQEGSDSFHNLQELKNVDTAVFHVRRKTPSEQDLEILRNFIDSGKGFVALRSTSHAWENWPDFDKEVLGATYQGTFHVGDKRSPSMDVIDIYQHPIFTGARDFSTDQYMYQYEDIEDDVQIIMEGSVDGTTTPMAWTRTYKGGRIFRLVPNSIDMMQDSTYLKIIGNGIMWVKNRDIPDAEVSIQRTYMPDAHPGSIAVIFPQGPGICYDPVRGGINYIWDGDYIDLRPRWTTKQGKPANFTGEVFYSEKNWQPMRSESLENDPEYNFRGYKVINGSPVINYTINGRMIQEELRPLNNGYGIARHFQIEGNKPLLLKTESQSNSDMTITGAILKDNYIHYDGTADSFIVEIQMK